MEKKTIKLTLFSLSIYSYIKDKFMFKPGTFLSMRCQFLLIFILLLLLPSESNLNQCFLCIYKLIEVKTNQPTPSCRWSLFLLEKCATLLSVLIQLSWRTRPHPSRVKHDTYTSGDHYFSSHNFIICCHQLIASAVVYKQEYFFLPNQTNGQTS